ncbi:DNA primase [Ignicoccus islandicus DSM 13165]|uniref:DNA primase DnaG n=1 Tax=Ignicoccus islandicus DSM 13165 TaxID=940295 RepID=A0A0U2VBX4_9CREN|nr:DNA primase DnaG [Ignicoccus islandicus]ALU11602.1 DNA primase [Ignicoccus islandicus DSM 13165]
MVKYIIKAHVEVEGPVNEHDIIGAIFGQTEGLLGEQFDLRELQDKNRIGRIIVKLGPRQGNKVSGEILIPSNLDRVETALLAALIESVEKVGPYPARIRVIDIIDVRAQKIKSIIERAKEILRKWEKEKTMDVREILKEITESVRTADIIEYGPEKLPAGPDVDKSDTVIIVEGRADVLNLLRYGYTNAIALGGATTKIPETIKRLAKDKVAIAFVDGDRGGTMILKELLREADIDYVARAPPGKEVEDLTGREIARALANLMKASEVKAELEKMEQLQQSEMKELKEVLEKVSEIKKEEESKSTKPEEKEKVTTQTQIVQEVKEVPQTQSAIEVQVQQPQVEKEKLVEEKESKVTVPTEKGLSETQIQLPAEKEEKEVVEYKMVIPEEVFNKLNELTGRLEAIIYDSNWNVVKKVPTRDLVENLKEVDDVRAVVMDGVVTQRLLDVLGTKNPGTAKLVLAKRMARITHRPKGVFIILL